MDILPQLLVNALIAGSIYALASSGLSLTYGLLKVLNFAHGHIMMVGAYAFYFGAIDQEGGWILGAFYALLTTVFLSIATLEIFVNPFLVYSSFLPFVTTLALSTMLESMVSMIFGVNVKSLTVGIELQSIEWHGIFITPIQILIIISALVLLSTTAFIIHSTALGRKIRALSQHAQAAQTLGISDRAIIYGVFTLGMLLATYAGILIGLETNLQPTMGNAYTIKAFAAMILGGLGNIWGTVLGSYLLGIVENLSIGIDFGPYSLPAGYKDAFAYMIILLVLLVRPQGLFTRRGRVA